MLQDATVRRRIREKLAAQQALVRALLALRGQLGGSLFARYAECGKDTCSCRQGRKHGPYYVLSTRSGGQGGFAYMDRARAQKARHLVEHFREFRRGLRRLKKINLDLVGLLRRYQANQSARAGRRLGIMAVDKTTP